jgi:uncharacterized phage infection (PIP) family protein YhgE
MGEDIMGKNFCKNILSNLAFVLIFALSFSAIEAEAANKESELFDKGYEYSISDQPEKAVETFNLFLKEFPESSSRDAAMYWLGKSLIQVKLYGEAKKVFSEIIKQFPESPFAPHSEKELHALDTQYTFSPNAGVRSLADSVVKAINELQLKLTETEQKAAVSETALSQSIAERERLQALLEDEKQKLAAKDAEINTLAEKAAKGSGELQLKLTETEQKAAASETALSQSVAERERLQALLEDEKQKLAAKDAEIKNLVDNAARAINELQMKITGAPKKAGDSEADTQRP